MINRNNTIIYQKEYDDVRMEYGKTVEEPVIPKVDDTILNEVWNLYTIQKVPDPKLNKE